MADPHGFLKRSRQEPDHRPATERVHDWQETYPDGDIGRAMKPTIREQAGRCMDCGVPFCHLGCPLGNLIPEWNDLVWRDDWLAASDRLHATNNFPEFTGRLCPAPCETACVLAVEPEKSGGPVTIKNVEVAIAERAFEEGWLTPQPPEWLTGRTVAVVGSGPAGLACAQQLTRAGHTVAVFERADRIGGLLRYGIPEFKMEKRIVDRRLAQLAAEGTRFRPGVNVGVDITADQLRRRYDAVVLAVGSTIGRELPIPGRQLAGIHQAMEFLPQANRASLGQDVPDQITAAGKDVVIIGGGDTGSDCLGTVHRQGPRSVAQLEIMPRPGRDRPGEQPWPMFPMVWRESTSQEEGGRRLFACSTEEFLADDAGRVRALRLVEVRRTGRGFTAVPGSEREMPAQLVLLAMGFTGPEQGPLVRDLGLSITDRGTIARDARFTTSVPGVFVAGDAGRGQSLIVWAIAEGRSAAAAVHAYLGGLTPLPAPIQPLDRAIAV